MTARGGGADGHRGSSYGRPTLTAAKRQNESHARRPRPVEVDEPSIDETVAPDRPWIVLVWNDPINLMSYVTFVFQKLFGYSLEKATELMLDVHHKGRAVVSNGAREKAELDVFRLHEHGLWATMQQDDVMVSPQARRHPADRTRPRRLRRSTSATTSASCSPAC